MNKINILPTDKPSRLWTNNLLQGKLKLSKEVLIGSNTAKHIYITSDEEIKEGDFILSVKTNNVFKADSIDYLESHNVIEDFNQSYYINSNYAKKIILTTDQDFIDNGVQSIDNDFLERLVKDSNCEGGKDA